MRLPPGKSRTSLSSRARPSSTLGLWRLKTYRPSRHCHSLSPTADTDGPSHIPGRPKPFHFGDGHTGNAESGPRGAHFLEPERFD